MDRGFMEHYYDIAYEDIVDSLTSNNDEFEKANSEAISIEKDLLDACGDTYSLLWNKIEKMKDAHYKILRILLKLAYLKGAEDRERMLR